MTDHDRAAKKALRSALKQVLDALDDELADRPPVRGPAPVKPATRSYSDTAKAKAMRGLKAG